MWHLAPHILLIRHEGDGEESLIAPFAVAIRRELAKRPCHLFHDTTQLRKYETGYRVEMTNLFRAEKDRMLSLQALVTSKIVAMGAAVANLAMGGIVKIYAREAQFEEAITRALAEEKARASR